MGEEKKIYIKEYNYGSGLLVAICDTELIGKSFEEGGLSLTISEVFYKGEVATESDVVRSLKHATIANLVGKRTIQCALGSHFIEEVNIIFVDGVPHAQMVKI